MGTELRLMLDHLDRTATPHCVCRRATGDYRWADRIFVAYKGVLQGVADIVVAYTVMARKVMAYIVTACILMACLVMAYIDLYSYGQ